MKPAPRTRFGFAAARFVAAAGLAAATLGAAADVIDIVWDDAGRFDKALSVPPGAFAEVCGKLSNGQAVASAFKAAQPMEFNIQHHGGVELHFATREDQGLAAQGILEASSEQHYCWMWTNKRRGAVGLSIALARR